MIRRNGGWSIGTPSEMTAFYPTQKELEDWVASIWDLAKNTKCEAHILEENGFSDRLGVFHFSEEFRYVQFSPQSMDTFYGYWQPAHSTPAPLLVHVPGYGAEMSTHPALVREGYNVLHICPLGYVTPEGPDESKKENTDWPVLPNTVSSQGEKGYKNWLANCLMAIDWAMNQPEVLRDRVSFFGTSQGGGGALLLGSLYHEHGVRCVAADLPFLTHFMLADGCGAYGRASRGFRYLEEPAAGWKALGFIDTLSHAYRLTVPVLLTAGGKDDTCPPETIDALFNRLPGTRSLTYLKNGVHRYSNEFIPLASAWFRLYA
ncbi:MAG TPA: acetylxylan esterase [Bacillales bacterium]|nr:acetylxylan esterase [Bacillales bacterium]